MGDLTAREQIVAGQMDREFGLGSHMTLPRIPIWNLTNISSAGANWTSSRR